MGYEVYKHRKGQAAVEFYSYLVFFLLVFAVAVWMYYDYTIKSTEQKQYEMVEQVAAYYAMPIELAVRFGDGYNGNFKPVRNPLVKINSVYYRSGFVIINWSSAENPVNYYSYPLLTEDFSFNMVDPLDCINITNNNGVIVATEYGC